MNKQSNNISVSIKEFFNALLNERDKRINLHFEQMDRAVTKAEIATEKRFEGVNEFRNTLSDQQRTFVPRQEYENGHKVLSDKIEDTCKKLDRIENIKQGGNSVWAFIISGVSLIGMIIAISISLKGCVGV